MNPFRRTQGKAHTAAVKASRPLEIVDGERKQVFLQLGALEYQRRALDAEVQGLAARAQALDHERGLAEEKAQQEKAEAEKLAAQESK